MLPLKLALKFGEVMRLLEVQFMPLGEEHHKAKLNTVSSENGMSALADIPFSRNHRSVVMNNIVLAKLLEQSRYSELFLSELIGEVVTIDRDKGIQYEVSLRGSDSSDSYSIRLDVLMTTVLEL